MPKITVEIEVPDGRECVFERELCIYSSESYCNIFKEWRDYHDFTKCSNCLKASGILENEEGEE